MCQLLVSFLARAPASRQPNVSLHIPVFVCLAFRLSQSMTHKKVIEKELDGFGIRLNQKPPDIVFRKKDKGGLNYQETVPQVSTKRSDAAVCLVCWSDTLLFVNCTSCDVAVSCLYPAACCLICPFSRLQGGALHADVGGGGGGNRRGGRGRRWGVMVVVLRCCRCCFKRRCELVEQDQHRPVAEVDGRRKKN